MRSPPASVLFWLNCLAACWMISGAGCASAKPPQSAPNPLVAASILNNSYSLLHQLLDEQKDVSLLRFIKREPSDVKELVKRIAAESKTGAKALEKMAKQDASLSLQDFRLPEGEVAVRAALADTKKKELLGFSGDRFELSLLLTQFEALRYASHLAQVAAAHETQPDRVRILQNIHTEMESLFHDAFNLLLSKTDGLGPHPAVKVGTETISQTPH